MFKIFKSKRNKFLLLIGLMAIMIFIGFAYPMFQSKPPTSIIRKFIAYTISRNIEELQKDGKSSPDSLRDLHFFNNKVEECSRTMTAPWTKCLIVYDPNFKDDSKDWIAIVAGGYDGFLGKFKPVVLWNDYSYEEYPEALNLTKEKSNLKYYYYDY